MTSDPARGASGESRARGSQPGDGPSGGVEPSRAPSPRARFLRVFKAYDVRGLVPDELDTAMTWAIGAAFGAFARRNGAARVVLGRDMRPSGVDLSRALAAGVRHAGLNVLDAGLVSTDMAYFASGHLDAPAAMLTASHNPAQYNGIKLCLQGARPIGEETGLVEIRDAAVELYGSLSPSPVGSGPSSEGPSPAGSGPSSEGPIPAPAPWQTDPGVDADPEVEKVDLLEAFSEHVRSFAPAELRAPESAATAPASAATASAGRKLSVVADTANGMGGLVAPAVFEGLPIGLDLLYGDLDGNFPNHPADPIQPDNLVDLQARVLATGADAGLAFDGDADRVFLVDELAEPLSGSLTTSIVAAAMLDAEPGATVLYNLICSKAVPEVIEEHGGTAIRTRVGHSFIKARMAETGALFGGEHSGHYYFRDNFRADSGIIAAVIVLGVMAATGKKLSEIRRPLERYADSGELNTEVSDTEAVIAAVAEDFQARGALLDWTDGLTADCGDWWFNLRPSNTEPLLRLNVEAADSSALRAHTRELQEAVRHLDAAAKDAAARKEREREA